MSTRDGVPFPLRCSLEGLPEPVREYAFAREAGRRWRFDWAWPDARVALEIEGGLWTGGRHTIGKGFLQDLEKYNEAQLYGWIVLRCVPSTLCAAATFELVRRGLNAHRLSGRDFVMVE